MRFLKTYILQGLLLMRILSTNDWCLGIPLGSLESRDSETLMRGSKPLSPTLGWLPSELCNMAHLVRWFTYETMVIFHIDVQFPEGGYQKGPEIMLAHWHTVTPTFLGTMWHLAEKRSWNGPKVTHLYCIHDFSCGTSKTLHVCVFVCVCLRCNDASTQDCKGWNCPGAIPLQLIHAPLAGCRRYNS